MARGDAPGYGNRVFEDLFGEDEARARESDPADLGCRQFG